MKDGFEKAEYTEDSTTKISRADRKRVYDQSFNLTSRPIIQKTEDCSKIWVVVAIKASSSTNICLLILVGQKLHLPDYSFSFFFVDLKPGLLGDETTIAKILFCLYIAQSPYFTTHEDELSLVVVDYGFFQGWT